jgi:hypothetical protein
MLNDKGIDIDGKSPTTQWKDMAFVFTEPNHIEFTYDNRIEIIIPSQKTGLKTAEGKYNEEYNSLLKFAIAKGTITKSIHKRVRQISVTQKNVSSLRTWLRELTGRNDNPITYSKVTAGSASSVFSRIYIKLAQMEFYSVYRSRLRQHFFYHGFINRLA